MSNNSDNNGRGRATINVHLGNALVIIAGTYRTLLDTVLEMIQNCIDEGASRIDVKVDYSGRNKGQGKSAPQVSVIDNGNGCTIPRFNSALTHVCETQKEDDKLGRFGIGLISPLGKCGWFTFTSCGSDPSGVQLYKYVEWKFDTDDIRQRKNTAGIPFRFRDELLHEGDQRKISPRHGRFQGRSPNIVWWRSRMDLHNLAPESEIGTLRLEELKREAVSRFGVVMARRKIRVRIEITDSDGKNHCDDFTSQGYLGEPIPVHTIVNKHAGKVTFRLFVAPRAKSGRRSGTVNVGESQNDFRFPIRYLFSKQDSRAINPDAIEALREGTLEGEVIAERVTLHPSRQAFVTNDASAGLLEAIEEWFNSVGAKVVAEAREVRKDERLQQIGVEVMARFRHLLPNIPNLKSVLDMFKFGTTGIGHAEVPGKVGEQVVRTISADGVSPKKPQGEGSNGESKPRDRSEAPDKEKGGHHPPTVEGPKGKFRSVVKDSSTGLSLSFTGMETSMDLWELDLEHGILRFNQRHPVWVMCEESDKHLISLQILVIIQALTLALEPLAVRDHQRKVLNAVTENYVKGWILSEARVGVPKRRKAKKTDEK